MTRRGSAFAWLIRALASAFTAVALMACGQVQQPKVTDLPIDGIDLDAQSGAAATNDQGVLGSLSAMASKAMEAMGLKDKPVQADESTLPAQQLPDRRIRWRVHASPALNVSDAGDSLAVVTRFYRLKSPEAFLSAPREAFNTPQAEQDALGDDLISVREVLLVPGRQHDLTERLPRDVGFVGVIALFHSPAAGRWRHAFDTRRAELTGIHLGAHACALSVHAGRPVDMSTDEARRASVRCPASQQATPAPTEN